MRVERREIELPASGGRLVVVSDTHGHPHPAAADLIRAEAPVAILHAGDVGRLSVLDALLELAPVIAVRGNTDPRGDGLPDLVDVAVTWDQRRLGVLLTHIAVRGPRLLASVQRLADARETTVVVCGHSHVPLIARDGPSTIFNPGSMGPRRFGLPITFGVMDFDAAGVSLRHVDCETGATWRPPALSAPD